MEQKSNNPLEENDFTQAERDRVFEKYQTLLNLFGAEKAKDRLTPHEKLVFMNTLANKAIEHYDEKLAQIAFWKIGVATGGKPPASKEEMFRLSEKCLNRDEKVALLGYFSQKMRNPKGSFGVREIKK
jgi:hypothetical protein